MNESGLQETSNRHGDNLGEGDLVTEIIDIVNDRTYMIAPNPNENRADENGATVCVYLPLTDSLTLASTRWSASSRCKLSRETTETGGI